MVSEREILIFLPLDSLRLWMQAKVFSQKVNFLRENLECSFWMEEKVRLCIQTALRKRTLLSYLFTANANSR